MYPNKIPKTIPAFSFQLSTFSFNLSVFILFWLCPLITNPSFAQQTDRNVEIGLSTNLGAEAPFWLEHNRYGLVSETSGYRMSINYKGRYAFEEPLRTNPIRLEWGMEMTGGNRSAVMTRPLHQLYAGIRYGALQVRAGMWQETVGIVDPVLSAGPSIWSRNVRPMPKIKAELTDFTSVPYTNDWFQVKAGLSHGWFESGRPVEDFWLHEKYLYGKVGKQGYPELYAGLIHMGQWGGFDTRQFGDLPDSFRDYWRIFLGREGGEAAPEPWQVNRFGNSLGSWQAGIMWNRESWELLLNKETIFEDGSGYKLRSPEDGVQGITLRWFHEDRGEQSNSITYPNQLIGSDKSCSSCKSHESRFTYEFWHTKSQSGPGMHAPPPGWEGDRDPDGHRFGGRDNYFNHSVYRHGWSYYDKTIGVPFITHDPSTGRKTNNRMIGHHIGLMHSEPRWSVKLLYSWTKNYGTYARPFDEPLTQNYSMLTWHQDLSSLLNLPVSVTTELGLDWGDYRGDRVGVMVSIIYRALSE